MPYIFSYVPYIFFNVLYMTKDMRSMRTFSRLRYAILGMNALEGCSYIFFALTFHSTVHFSAVFFFLDGNTLVVFLLTTAETDDEFGTPVLIDVEA